MLSSLTWKYCQCWQTAFDLSFLDFTVLQKSLSVCVSVLQRKSKSKKTFVINCNSRMSVLSKNCLKISCDLITRDEKKRQKSTRKKWHYYSYIKLLSQTLSLMFPLFLYGIYTQTLWWMHTEWFPLSQLSLTLSLLHILFYTVCRLFIRIIHKQKLLTLLTETEHLSPLFVALDKSIC